MKKSAKIILLFLLLALVLAFGLWMFRPQNKHVTDPDRYGRYNHYTRELLGDFAGILPASIPGTAQNVAYGYDFVEGIDRSFIIDLAYTLDEESYYAEKARLGHLSGDSRLIDGKHYYVCSTGDLDEFFNDTVLDGYTYKVEIAVCADDAYSIRYFVSSYVENMIGGEKVGELLRPLYDDDHSSIPSALPAQVFDWLIKNKGK